MRRKLLGLAGVLSVMLVGAGYARGGWAVVTVETLPDHIVAGRGLPFEFTVRQHGEEPMATLRPTVLVTSNGRQATVNAMPTSKVGTYRATLAAEGSGNAEVEIRTGFGEANLKLLPMRIAAAGTRPAPQTLQERGRHLFVAKGCISCHQHSAAPGTRPEYLTAPDLTTVRYTPEYLRAFITDPTIKPPTMPLRMPKLGLAPDELNAVVSFLTAKEQVAAR